MFIEQLQTKYFDLLAQLPKVKQSILLALDEVPSQLCTKNE